MARKPTVVEENPRSTTSSRGRATAVAPVERVAEPLYIWERISGKHHLRTSTGIKTISPGERLHARKDAYEKDRNWKLIGPVGGALEVTTPPKFALKKVKAENEGEFNVFREGEEKPLNDKPLTEAEADELVNASLESP